MSIWLPVQTATWPMRPRSTDATSTTFPGQGHGAPPEMVAPVLTAFFLAN